ncbi:hypothetical protein THIOKS12370064 [Thiocapsa sp. KS1]|nr:hypothetical protein THIOKS12370064 [Thiocapsa sp. KS1]
MVGRALPDCSSCPLNVSAEAAIGRGRRADTGDSIYAGAAGAREIATKQRIGKRDEVLRRQSAWRVDRHGRVHTPVRYTSDAVSSRWRPRAGSSPRRPLSVCASKMGSHTRSSR